MQLKPEQIAANCQKQILPVYLLAGEETLIIQEALDQVREAAKLQGYDERQVMHADRGFDWQQVLSAGQEMSLFSDKRILDVIVETSGPGRDGSTVIREYCSQPPDDTLLIIRMGALDKSARNSSWYKACNQAGAVMYTWPVKDRDFMTWLNHRLKSRGLHTQPEALQLLAWRNEGNLLAAAQEIDKLVLLCPQGQVTESEVKEVVADNARFDPFDLIDKLVTRQPASAIRTLDRLREEGVDPLGVLGSVAWVLRGLSLLHDKGPGKASFRAINVWGQRQQAFVSCLNRLPQAQIDNLLLQAARVDRVCKGMEVGDPWEELIKLVAPLAGLKMAA